MAITFVEGKNNVAAAASTTVIFANGYSAKNTIVVGASVGTAALGSATTPWHSGDLSNTANYTWTFWGNSEYNGGSNGYAETGVWYTVVPSTISVSDTITAANSGSADVVGLAVAVYSGVGTIRGAGASGNGNGAPTQTGNYTVVVNDINIGIIGGRGGNEVSGSGWTERENGGYIDLEDQIAASTTANATWGDQSVPWAAVGIAFTPTPPIIYILGHT